MNPLLVYIPLILLVGGFFLFILTRRQRHHHPHLQGRPDDAEPAELRGPEQYRQREPR